MRNKYICLLIIITVLLVTGCSVHKLDNNLGSNIKYLLSHKSNMHNVHFDGYSYYVPKGIKFLSKEEYNSILLDKYDNKYYLFVDVVAYYHKTQIDYKINNNSHYSRVLDYNDIKGYNNLLNKDYKNNIVFLDDQRIVIGLALMSLGYDMNETDTNKLKEAEKWLLDLKKNIKAYDSDSPKTFFITDEVDIGVMWSAEAILARAQNHNIEIVYPSEGHAISMDNYTILKGAKNKDNAYLFIDYLLRTDVSQKIVEEYPYISPNKNISNSIGLNEIFKDGYYVKNIGSKIKQYDKLWANIK